MFSRRRLGAVVLFVVVVLAIYGIDRLPILSFERVVLMALIGFIGANAVRGLWLNP